MNLCRYNNRQCRYNAVPCSRENKQKPECTLQYTHIAVSSFGGITLSEASQAGEEYDLVLLDVIPRENCGTYAEISFSCNINLVNTAAEISFQLYRLQSQAFHPRPVASPVVYKRSTPTSISDSISFHACDCLYPKTQCCTYIIKIRIINSLSEGGSVITVNPVLTVLI